MLHNQDNTRLMLPPCAPLLRTNVFKSFLANHKKKVQPWRCLLCFKQLNARSFFWLIFFGRLGCKSPTTVEEFRLLSGMDGPCPSGDAGEGLPSEAPGGVRRNRWHTLSRRGMAPLLNPPPSSMPLSMAFFYMYKGCPLKPALTLPNLLMKHFVVCVW